MKKTLFLVAALCAAVAQAETIKYDSDQTVSGDKTLTEDTTIEVAGGATVTRKGNITGDYNLTKDGAGTLEARVNDSAGASGKNSFTGDVTVNAGVLKLVGTAGSVNIGAGDTNGNVGSVITVAKGAKLQIDETVGINIPRGNSGDTDNVSVAIRNSNEFKNSYNDGDSYLSNVRVSQNGISAVDSSVRGTVYAFEVGLTDSAPDAAMDVVGTNVYANNFTVSGHATVDNSTIIANDILARTSIGSQKTSMTVINGSRVILDSKTTSGVPASARLHYGMLSNTEVDKTSYINAGDEEGKLMTTSDMTYIQLYNDNTLHVAATDKGGVAVRDVRQDIKDFKSPIEVVYVTEQLSGCALNSASGLLVTLDETMPWDPTKYEDFTFTVVLKGLDSSAVLPPGAQDDFVHLDNSPVKLYVQDFAEKGITMDTMISIRQFMSYGSEGPATVFRFHLENVIPEPATATLSLLALAGLAARRRRH